MKREVFFEFIRLEENVRVCAVDGITGIEVVTVVPASLPQSEAQKRALNKLLWRLEREGKGTEEGGNIPDRPPGKYI